MLYSSYQSTKIAAYVVVSMIGAAQPTYAMRSDADDVRFSGCKPQKTESANGLEGAQCIAALVARMNTIPDESVFGFLATEWKQHRRGTASLDALRDPNYVRIIGMGEKALPFIFAQLRNEVSAGEPDHWFAALWAITGENPIKETSQGRIFDMAADWLSWGAHRGY